MWENEEERKKLYARKYMRDYREQQKNKTLAMAQELKELFNTAINTFTPQWTPLKEDASPQEIAEVYKKIIEHHQNLQYLQIAIKGFQTKYGLAPLASDDVALSGTKLEKPHRLTQEKDLVKK
jgi:hypothetical protein